MTVSLLKNIYVCVLSSANGLVLNFPQTQKVTAMNHDVSNFEIAPTWMRIVAALISSATVLVGGTGNLVTLLAFATHKHMRTKKNIYIFCLTVSDLIITTFVTLQYLEQFLVGRWRHSLAWCRMFQTITTVAFVSSMNLVALVSRDRMLMVTKGAAYDAHESAARKFLLVLINAIFLLVFTVPYTSLDIFTGYSMLQSTGQCQPEQIQNLYVTIANQIIFPVPPIVYMLYCYARVRRYVKHQRLMRRKNRAIFVVAGQTRSSTFRGTTVFGNKSTAPVAPNVYATAPNASTVVVKVDKASRTTKIMNVLLLATIIGSQPSAIMSFVMDVLIANPDMVSRETYAWWSHLFDLTNMTCILVNAFNPILYAYALPSFRSAMRDVFRRAAVLLRCAKKQQL